MADFYFDSSAIIKRYVTERGSSWVRALANPANDIQVVRLTSVEVASAVTRRERAGSLKVGQAAAIMSQFLRDVTLEYFIIEITVGLIGSSVSMARKHGLRAYDAVQLAAAANLHSQRMAGGLGPLTLVSADQELNVAAAKEGLIIEDPNLHP